MTIFLLPIGIFLFGALLVKLRTSILDALKLSALSYVYSWLFFAFSWVCVWLCTSILNFIGFSLNWGDFILNNNLLFKEFFTLYLSYHIYLKMKAEPQKQHLINLIKKQHIPQEKAIMERKH